MEEAQAEREGLAVAQAEEEAHWEPLMLSVTLPVCERLGV